MRLIAAVGIEMGTRQAFEIAENILQMLQTKHSGKARRDGGTCGGRIAHNEFDSCRGSDAPTFGPSYGFTSAGGKSTAASIAGTRSVGI